MLTVIGSLGFLVAGLLYIAAAALILSAHPATRVANFLVVALSVSALWAFGAFAASWRAETLASWLLTIDAIHSAGWVAFVAATLGASGQHPTVLRLERLLIGISLGLVIATIAASVQLVSGAASVAFFALLCLPLVGLLGLEQIFRNADFRGRVTFRPLVLAVGSIFALDFFVYSQAILFGGLNAALWLMRGIANAAIVPLIIVAIKKQPEWERRLFVSRQAVFYTTSLIAVGLYLFAVGIVGHLIGGREDSWGPLGQGAFFVGAAVTFSFAIFSSTVQRQVKVFIAKHFYRNRYDYREEWLRLIRTLAARDQQESLSARSVRALGQIVGSTRGELWLMDEPRAVYEASGSWPAGVPAAPISEDDVLVSFMRRSRWVIDTEEYLRDSEKYANAFASDSKYLAVPSIFVPLFHQGQLSGIVRLDRPASLPNLTYEDHDLLKTAAQQVAIFLVQERDQERLAEARQLEAFSKLTTFLMHDLKNLIAQQELVVGNAQKFKHKPEFVDDAMRTIESGVQRMRRVLDRLKGAATVDNSTLIDVHKLVLEVVSNCADRVPVPIAIGEFRDAVVAGDREKLAMALTHALRNAQDATSPDGSVEVRVERQNGWVSIDVADNGTGMDPAFVREHLFKPFDSTKGASGMGIGAYQIRETVRGAGGQVEVQSAVGEGTTVRMKLPAAVRRRITDESIA